MTFLGHQLVLEGAMHNSVGFKTTLSNYFKSDARSSFRQFFFQTEAINEPLPRLLYAPPPTFMFSSSPEGMYGNAVVQVSTCTHAYSSSPFVCRALP